jgi:glycosyltransferase involved in cell wall biosynthesis
MKIGIDASRLGANNKTGTVSYLYEIIKQLNEIDKINEYFLYVNNDIILDFELNKNWHICVCECKHRMLWFYFRLYKILKKDKINVFWGPDTFLPKKTRTVKTILTIHDLVIEKFPNLTSSTRAKILYEIFTKKACKIADEIICVSEATKNDLIGLLHVEEDRTKVIYEGTSKLNSINKVDEEKALEKYNLNSNKFLLYVSTIQPRKNVDTIVKSFEVIKSNNKNANLKLVIAGKRGWQCEDVFNIIENSKYKNDIIVTGHISDKEKQALYKNTCLFLYPSLYEGFGLPILEAMAEGKMVITTKCSSLPEVGGDAALYINSPKDENELAELINYALNLNDEEKNEIIRKGYEQVKKFDWNITANELLKEFNKLGE